MRWYSRRSACIEFAILERADTRNDMPFYEYQCKSCGHDLEAMQKISDPPLKKCPQCGKSQLRRLMSAPVFRLKGGGWYETDFKGDQDNKRNLADRPETDAAAPTRAPRTRRRTATRARRPTGRTPRRQTQAPARTRHPRTRRTSPPTKAAGGVEEARCAGRAGQGFGADAHSRARQIRSEKTDQETRTQSTASSAGLGRSQCVLIIAGRSTRP